MGLPAWIVAVSRCCWTDVLVSNELVKLTDSSLVCGCPSARRCPNTSWPAGSGSGSTSAGLKNSTSTGSGMMCTGTVTPAA